MEWKKILSEAGYRLSQPRCTVMRILEDNSLPMTPLAIYQQAIELDLPVGLVSVYRALELLKALGLVTEVYMENGDQGFVPNSSGHTHHIVCKECHQVIEFIGEEDLSSLFERVHQETGFEVNGHLLQLFGLCPACQKGP